MKYQVEKQIKEGIKVTINVNENTPYDFYVIKDDGNKVTLIMSENWGDNVKWYASGDNSQGLTTALAALIDRTNDWEIPEFTYALSGLGEDGTTQIYPASQVTGKARLITYAEANAVGCTTTSCPTWMHANLYDTGDDSTDGYWTSTANADESDIAWYIYCDGFLNNDFINNSGSVEFRLVIELSK